MLFDLLGIKQKRERKPVQTSVKKPKLYTFFLIQTTRAIYDWQEDIPASCFARALLEGRKIVRIQIVRSWPNPQSVINSFRDFESIADYELVEVVPCSNEWE